MKRLGVRLAISYLLLALLVLAGAGGLTYLALKQHLEVAHQATTSAQLDAATLMVAALSAEGQAPAEVIDEVHRQYPEVGITLVELRVNVLRPPVAGEFGLPVPGVLGVRRLLVSRPGAPAGERLVPIAGQNGSVSQAFRVAPGTVNTGVARLQKALLGAGALGMLAAVAIAFWFSRNLTAPLQRMALAAGRLAEGEWETPMPTGGPTEMTALAEAFQAMAVRLRTDFQALRADREALQRLSAEVAHELKTPVASLRTYHELLLDGEQENPANRQELLKRGAAQVARLEYLAEFLVDMARLQAHAAPLDREEVDLTELVRMSVLAVSPAAVQRRVAVRVELPAGPVRALASPHRIGQALDNLLLNALRYSPDGGELSVRLRVGGGMAHITVADQGPGIEPAILERLFEPFARGADSRGLGMGLAIVKAVAESHGGVVTGANQPGGGALFTIGLPLQGEP